MFIQCLVINFNFNPLTFPPPSSGFFHEERNSKCLIRNVFFNLILYSLLSPIYCIFILGISRLPSFRSSLWGTLILVKKRRAPSFNDVIMVGASWWIDQLHTEPNPNPKPTFYLFIFFFLEEEKCTPISITIASGGEGTKKNKKSYAYYCLFCVVRKF